MGVCCGRKRKNIEGMKITDFKAFIDDIEKELREINENNEKQGNIDYISEYEDAEDLRLMYCYSASLKFILNVNDILEKNKVFLEKNNELKLQIKEMIEKFQHSREDGFQPENVK